MKILPILIAILILMSGCITSGGKKLVGVVPTGHGTYRLQSAVDREKREAAEKKKAEEEKKKAEEARQKALLKAQSKQVKLPPARSKPVIPAPQSAKAVDAPIKIAPADSRTPFTPSVSGANLSPADSLIEDLKTLGEEDNKIIINEEESHEDKAKITVDWPRLWSFYLVAAMFLVLVYFGYKVAKLKTEKLTGKKTPAKKRATKKTAKKRK